MKETLVTLPYAPEFAATIGGVALLEATTPDPATDAVQKSLDRRGQGGPNPNK
ncbi:MAG: hypothetical protein AAB834_03070 [Patescibacteria group bacterium]